MTTMPQTMDNKVRPVNSRGNIAATVNPSEFPQSNTESTNVMVQLPSVLQTTLSIEQILTQFSKEINSTLPHDNLSFVREANNTHFVIGERARHSCSYELTILEESLGYLSVTREHQFADSEIETLEKYICTLHYPLRNAILYEQAIIAANKDVLTGIGNRGAMNTTLRREIELALRHNRSLGIIMMDVDHFKAINDSFGHAAGDKILKSLVQCAEKSVRISDTLFRYGGEEFIIVLPETDATGVLRLAKRIRRRVEKLETHFDDKLINITISLGITTLRETDDEKTFFARADQALYKAKREGRNCIRIAADD